MSQLSNRILSLCKKNGVTQSQLSQMTGISKVTINHFFNDKADLKTKNLLKILGVLDIDILTLFDEQNIKSQTTSKCIQGIVNELDPLQKKVVSRSVISLAKDNLSNNRIRSYVLMLEQIFSRT